MNENDLRVQRSRALLQEALIALVTQNGYEAVTIRAITQQARVGYKTFFRHYESKEALLQTIIDEFMEEFQAVLLSPTAPNAAEQNTLTVLQFSQKHATLMRVILQSTAADQLLKPIMGFGRKEGKRFFSDSGIPDEIVAHHFASSLISLLRWWLTNERTYSVEAMAGYIDRLLIRPLKNLKQVLPENGETTRIAVELQQQP